MKPDSEKLVSEERMVLPIRSLHPPRCITCP